MDIVYVVGNGSKWNNNELKYSLRSIVKYGKNIDKVCVVGYKPDFINDEIIHIPCEDNFDKKHKNILNKILTAVKSGLISDDFLISSDDHFYVKETDFNSIPVYWKNETIKGSDKNTYRKSLQETKELLQQNGLPVYQTNPHCNTHFNINVYNKYKHLFNVELPNGIETNCLMGNLLIKEGCEYSYYRDIKIKLFNNRQELLDKIGNSECFSIYDSAIDCGIGDYLEELFPNKCKYEK